MIMGSLDQAIAALKAENIRLQGELKGVRAAISALERVATNDHAKRMSASARRKIAAAQKERWAKWRAAQW